MISDSDYFNPQRHVLALGQDTFAYWQYGQSRKRADYKGCIIWLHATGLHSKCYDFMLAHLAAALPDWYVCALDQRGHGFTTAQANPQTLRSWSTYTDDATKFIHYVYENCIGPDAKLVLSGHSMGGAVATMAGAAFPQQLSGLGLFDPVFVFGPYADLRSNIAYAITRFKGLRSGNFMAQAAAKRREYFDDPRAAAEGFIGRGIFKSWPKEAIEKYVAGGIRPTAEILRPVNTKDGAGKGKQGEWRLACAPAWEAKTFETSVVKRVWPFLKKINCPSFVALAETGSVVRPGVRKSFNKLPHPPTVFTMSGTHCFPVEKAAESAEALVKLAQLH